MHPQVTQHLRSVTRSNFPPIMGKPPDLLRFLCTPAFLLSSPRPIRCICTQLSVALQSARHRFDIFFFNGASFCYGIAMFLHGTAQTSFGISQGSILKLSQQFPNIDIDIENYPSHDTNNKTHLPRGTSRRSTVAPSPPQEQLSHTFRV